MAAEQRSSGADIAAGRHVGLRQHLADTASRRAPVSALREICGGGSMPPRRTNERKPLERLSSAKAASRAAAITRLVGMMTAPSRRERLTMLRTLSRALDFVGIEDVVAGVARNDGGQLPGEIGDIFHAAIHALAGKRRHQMRGIAGEENAALSPIIGDARMERVNHAPFDLDGGEINERRKQPLDRCRRSRARRASRRAAA